MKQKKNIVVGLGEIGKPILKLFSKYDLVIGYDINPKLMNKKIFEQFSCLCSLFAQYFQCSVTMCYVSGGFGEPRKHSGR